MPRRLGLLLSVLLLRPIADAYGAQPAPAPRPSDSAGVRERLEQVLDERQADASTRAAEALTHRAQHPLDVNEASAPALSALPPLSPLLARRIVRHRRTEGPFSSVAALSAVDGMGTERLRALRPYLTVKRVPSVEDFASELELDVIQRVTRELKPGQGFSADSSGRTVQGSPLRMTTRLQLHHERHGHLALTLDKDPGEALRWQPGADWYGFDHVAGNLTLRDLGPVQTLVVGDFAAEFGQGATLWRGLSFGKGRDAVSPLVRSGRGIVPFQSTAEHRFFRGVATTVDLPSSVSATGFVSRRRRDATLDSAAVTGSSDGPAPARTLSTGGLHRTTGERAGRGAFGLTTAGGALEYDTPTLRVGAAGYRSRFDRPLRPGGDPYRRFDVSGRQTSMVGVYGSAFLGDYTLFGEVARAATGRYGGVLGASLDHDRGVEALLLARRFPASFAGLYNAAVGESGDTQNEVGVYVGVGLRVAEAWRVSGYVDQYRFPWVRFGASRPTRGLETRLVVEYDPRPWLSSYVQLRADRTETGTERTGPGGRRLEAVQPETRQSARWHTEYAFSDALTLRTRLEGSRFSTPTAPVAHGLLLAQGVGLHPVEPLEIDARLAVFDTDGFDARIYTYEHDLLYSFSVPVLYGDGRRSYILVQYAPTEALTLEAKYGVTWYPRRDPIGSGLTATDGPSSREVRFQVRWEL
jgi:hypothetical protein